MAKDLYPLFADPIGKQDAIKISRDLLKGKFDIKDLIQLILANKDVISSRASWVLEITVKKDPEIISKHLSVLIRNVPVYNHNGNRRNVLNAISVIDVPEKYQATLFDICASRIMDPSEVVAVKVHALENMTRIALKHHDLINEVIEIINDQLSKNSIAFASRAKKTLKRFEKVKNV